MGLHRLYSMQRAAIVMLGNSITYGVNWVELMGRQNIANRGISADNTCGMLNRMDYVYSLKPKICCVMAGINDIYAGVPIDTIFSNYKKIIAGLREHQVVPVIQSTLYVNAKWKKADQNNPLVTQLNDLLKKFAVDQKIDFLDINKHIASEQSLRDECTYDGIHLTAAGYSPWRTELEQVFKKNGL
jgi:lysophospholipase L1-like esterase